MVDVASGVPAEGGASTVTVTASGRVVGGCTSRAVTLVCTSETIADREETVECSYELAPEMDCRDACIISNEKRQMSIKFYFCSNA